MKIATDGWWKCWQWWAALALAPVSWFVLYLLDRPHIQPDWPLQSPWPFMMLVVLYPVLEEIVFRGLLQGWLISKAWGSSVHFGFSRANMITSLIFSALHLFSHAPLLAALVLLPSLIFGYFRDRFDGWLLPSIMLHCLYNAGYFLMYKP